MQTITTDEVRTVRHLDLSSRDECLAFLREHGLIRKPRFMVSGSRDWLHPELVVPVLAEIPVSWVMLEGEARGLDRDARDIWLDRGGTVCGFPARWSSFGRSAGHRRNEIMLACRPRKLLAWHEDLENSKGTRGACLTGWRLGLPVTIFDSRGASQVHQRDEPSLGWDELRAE